MVNNTAGVSVSVLGRAEGQASRIFRAAGVKIVWLECQNRQFVENCRRAPRESEFVLHLVSKGSTSSDSVFGEAFLGPDGRGKYCDVFLDRVVEASHDGVGVSQLLGAVAAHELGHLILGSHAHSRMGIMTPSWSSEALRQVSMGSIFFTRQQVSAMQERLGPRSPQMARDSATTK